MEPVGAGAAVEVADLVLEVVMVVGTAEELDWVEEEEEEAEDEVVDGAVVVGAVVDAVVLGAVVVGADEVAVLVADELVELGVGLKATSTLSFDENEVWELFR